jgi:hypothetical protein
MHAQQLLAQTVVKSLTETPEMNPLRRYQSCCDMHFVRSLLKETIIRSHDLAAFI